jgi:CRP-like cAMP-binding protein
VLPPGEGGTVATTSLDSLVRKMASINTLADAETAALAGLPVTIANLGVQHDIVREGDRPTRSCLLLEGYLFTSKHIGEGRRQITSLYVPGDIPDLQSVHLEVMDMTLTTLKACKVAFIQHEAIKAVCMDYPRLGFAFWRSTLIDAAIYREWVANIGQRSAVSRTAHLVCELLTRLQAVGLSDGRSWELPTTQTELADALGLSVVHMQRVLKELRTTGLIELRGKRLTVLNLKELREVGDFDPTYLHLREKAALAA